MASPHMRRAADLARQAYGLSSPNPAVGAVIVKDGVVVGEGHTQPPGQAHAEIVALRQAGEAARGGTIFVTLEPCSHFGRTPPCVDALLAAGIAEVRFAAVDPFPRVNGSGRKKLEEAGVRAVLEDDDEVVWELNAPYFKYLATGLPFVTVKYAMTLDGKIATRAGDSRWISGEASRAMVHELRARSDAIMVGVGTVLADNPQLTARDAAGRAGTRQPLRVIVDSQGRTPRDATLFHQPGKTLLATAVEEACALPQAKEATAETRSFPGDDGRVDLRALLRHLAQSGVVHLLVEGGGTLIGSLMDEGLVDRMMVFIAPVVAGGRDAPGPVLGQGVAEMAQAHRLQRVAVQQVERDVLVTGYVGEATGLYRG